MRTLEDVEKKMRKAQREAAKYKAVLRRISGMDVGWDARAPVSLAREALGISTEETEE